MRKSLTLGAGLLLTLAACATPPPPKPVAQAAKAQVGCVPDTATRLPVKGSECAGFGLSFSKQQLDSTGQPYADQELRMMDPAITGR